MIGCLSCHSTKGCDESYKEERQRIKNELSMRDKALADANFPDQNLINEFLVRRDVASKLNLKWTQPDLRGFVVSKICKISLQQFFFQILLSILDTNCVREY